MTTAQTQLYFRTWAEVTRAHGWNTKAGILAAIQRHHSGQTWESPALNQLLGKIYESALTTAAAADRDVTADDLRHACTAVILGRIASSKTLTNNQFDLVLSLLKVLADPCIRTIAALDDPQAGERRRYLHVITAAPEPYWKKIASDKFQTTDLDALSLEQLRQLSLTIRTRLRAREHHAAALQPA